MNCGLIPGKSKRLALFSTLVGGGEEVVKSLRIRISDAIPPPPVCLLVTS
jgi:hypothetical protein